VRTSGSPRPATVSENAVRDVIAGWTLSRSTSGVVATVSLSLMLKSEPGSTHGGTASTAMREVLGFTVVVGTDADFVAAVRPTAAAGTAAAARASTASTSAGTAVTNRRARGHARAREVDVVTGNRAYR